MKNEVEELQKLIIGMREVYAQGENAMEWARTHINITQKRNLSTATLIAYDLQAGTYVADASVNPKAKQRWSTQIAELIKPILPKNGHLLEVGVGEATTLVGVLQNLGQQVGKSYGFDISWSRVNVAQNWLKKNQQKAELFVGDLFNIPLADNSVDVVYSSHSLEPNGGREHAALSECLRVARSKVVLIEPLYELAQAEAQKRMEHHGYVRNLKQTAEKLGAKVLRYELLPYCSNPLNPSGVLTLEKTSTTAMIPNESENLQCPLTGTLLTNIGDVYYAADVGLAYPVLRGIPLLRSEHAIVASQLNLTERRNLV